MKFSIFTARENLCILGVFRSCHLNRDLGKEMLSALVTQKNITHTFSGMFAFIYDDVVDTIHISI